jgi:hypothetical protein
MQQCFKLHISIQDFSDLISHLPEDVILFIKIDPLSDQYYGIVRDDYYTEILRNAPRQSVDSIERVNKAEIIQFNARVEHEPYERYYGNRALLR